MNHVSLKYSNLFFFYNWGINEEFVKERRELNLILNDLSRKTIIFSTFGWHCDW